MWIRSLKAKLNNNILEIYAPNKFVLDWVQDKYLICLKKILQDLCGSNSPLIKFEIYQHYKEKKIKKNILDSANNKQKKNNLE